MTTFWPTAGKAAPWRVPEKAVQRDIVRALKLFGWRVFNLSQARASHQTAGLPDLIIFKPGRGVVMLEVKTAQGKLQPAQVEFQAVCVAAGVRHLVARSAAQVLAELEAV